MSRKQGKDIVIKTGY